MLQLPTGGGKTVIASALLSDWLQQKRKAVWLTHRRELADQTCQLLTNTGIAAVTDINWTPGTDAPPVVGGVVILMAQTVGRRTAQRNIWNRFEPSDLLIIDEAHHAAAAGWARAMKQWPGHILGMTATPWRLSEKEGLDHLFDNLICGPQTAELQAFEPSALCVSQVFIPPTNARIVGGTVSSTGDYNESGIISANQSQPNILTAGALEFWQKHACGRPTIVYAVSVNHAHNLAAVFNGAGVRSAVMLGDTHSDERKQIIGDFRKRDLMVLVNVAVATEGFDLPDASCIIVARPTLSLSLYLQMVGRGLRPKPDGGTCLILDLAANAMIHGLPEDRREWSLLPRGTRNQGTAPVIRCPHSGCDVASPAASHHCTVCRHPFGKECSRCGRWRAEKRWKYELFCGDVHELVCDLCHIDAHIQAHLPIKPPLDNLVGLFDQEGSVTMPSVDFVSNELVNRLSALIREFLERERQSVTGAIDARKSELRREIEQRQVVLDDDDELDYRFGVHIRSLPERPSRVQERRIFGKWEANLKTELSGLRSELEGFDRQVVDKEAVYHSARSKIVHLVQLEAVNSGLLPDSIIEGQKKVSSPSKNSDGEDHHSFDLTELERTVPVTGRQPIAIRLPSGVRQPVNSWSDIYKSVVDWLEDQGHLSRENIPSKVSKLLFSRKQKLSHKLKSGMYLKVSLSAKTKAINSRRFVEACGENPEDFLIQIQ